MIDRSRDKDKQNQKSNNFIGFNTGLTLKK